MAKAEVVQAEIVNDDQVIGYDASQFDWETVHTEAPNQIHMEHVGDTLVAEYLGQEEIRWTPTTGKDAGVEQSFIQLKFRINDTHYVLNAGYDLLKAYENVPPKTITRTELKTLVDVGQQSPMKSYRVDQARANNAGV
jgi:hypothetical protein